MVGLSYRAAVVCLNILAFRIAGPLGTQTGSPLIPKDGHLSPSGFAHQLVQDPGLHKAAWQHSDQESDSSFMNLTEFVNLVLKIMLHKEPIENWRGTQSGHSL